MLVRRVNATDPPGTACSRSRRSGRPAGAELGRAPAGRSTHALRATSAIEASPTRWPHALLREDQSDRPGSANPTRVGSGTETRRAQSAERRCVRVRFAMTRTAKEGQ
jgi:hypothetical protein